MKIDKDGNIKSHYFKRALMNSKARLTYEQAQNGIDFHIKGEGQLDPKVKPIMDDVIIPLYKAYQSFLKARNSRQCLELNLPEREVKLDRKTNTIGSITVKARYEAHKLIEEFMVAANVAAAETLKKHTCIYRVHDKPDPERLMNVRAFISEIGYSLTSKEEITSRHLNQLLAKVEGKPEAPLINEIVLRSQSQAVYGSYNIGHFGLSLEEYAHFTSPIRRYADLIVHRSLVKELGLGEGGLTDSEIETVEEISDHISITERRSVAAERDAKARYIAMYLSENIGAVFPGRISEISNRGIFIELDESGAEGFIPMKSLSDDYYIHDEKNHCLVGKRKGNVYRLTAKIKVKVAEASGLNASTLFEVVGTKGADIPWLKDSKIPGVKKSRRNSGNKGKYNKKRKRK
jgi:ribonuclease R